VTESPAVPVYAVTAVSPPPDAPIEAAVTPAPSDAELAPSPTSQAEPLDLTMAHADPGEA